MLLEARNASPATGSDVVVNADVTSGTGHITLSASDDVDVNDVVSTGGNGTVYVVAGDNADDTVQGIALDATLTTEDGDVLVKSSDDITQTALITSTNGDVGLIATDEITQTATGDITTADGDVLVQAGGDWTMDGDATITAGGQQVLGISGGTIELGVISVTDAVENHVALRAAVSILDANGAAINIQETVPASATTLSLRAADGRIGDAGATTSDTNADALDVNVDTLAADAETAIYVREVASGGALTVDTSAGVTVDIEGVKQVRFDSGITDASEDDALASLEDLTTGTDGPIKVVAENGTLTINGGSDTAGVSANGTGDVLLEARNASPATGSDVIVNADVTSGTGHITLSAADDVDVNDVVSTGGNGTVYVVAGDNADDTLQGIALDATLTTEDGDVLLKSSDDITQTALITSTNGDVGLVAADAITQTATGDITTTDGDVLVQAGGDWTMDGDATITAGGQQVLGTSGGTIELGVISVTDAVENHVALSAAVSILDANGAAINIEETVPASATTLSLRAADGRIGDAGATTSDTNADALDVNVDTLAADAETAIYVREVASGGALTVDTSAGVTVDIEGVKQVRFDSGITDASEDDALASLEDLTTGTDGPIKVVAENGTLTINGGSDTAGVSAAGTGDVLLEARNASPATGSDVVVNADVTSGTGHITLSASDDVDVNDVVSTGGNGTVYVVAGDNADDTVQGIALDATLTTEMSS